VEISKKCTIGQALKSTSTITPSIVHNRESEPTLSPVGDCPAFDVSQLGVFLPRPRLVREGAASIEYSDREPAINRSCAFKRAED